MPFRWWSPVLIAGLGCAAGPQPRFPDFSGIDASIPDSSLLNRWDTTGMEEAKSLGFRLPQVHRNLLLVRLASESPELLSRLLDRYDFTIVSKHSLLYLPSFYVRTRDRGPLWHPIQDLLDELEAQPGVVAVRTISFPLQGTEHYVGLSLDGRYQDDRLRITFRAHVCSELAESYLAEHGFMVLRRSVGPATCVRPKPGPFMELMDEGPAFDVGFGRAATTFHDLQMVVASLADSTTLRRITPICVESAVCNRIRLRG